MTHGLELEARSRLDPRPAPVAAQNLPWIRVADGAPYFVAETGEAWTPVGQNDGLSWIDFDGLFRRRDLGAVEAYLRNLVASGVTCLRLMLECGQHRHRYFEKPVGRFVPAMVQAWDDLFRLCEMLGLRLLLTPFDTFWTWFKWSRHPYNRSNGGPLDHPSRWLLDLDAREAIKARFSFAVRRWGGSGALFAWDLWNEIHPAHALDEVEPFDAFVADLSQHVRRLETELYGRAHLQTVSLFGPELDWKPYLDIAEPIFRHPDLDFATIHIYEQGTIDHPGDTVAAALAVGKIVRRSLGLIRDGRPFLDTEHGPIHGFKDRKITLPAAFDDEYFRHMQWAHLASGGVGGGMRWPYRKPHCLTPGMRAAQKAMAGFLRLIDWPRLHRRILTPRLIGLSSKQLACFACGDDRQAVVWCLRHDTIGDDGRLRRDVPKVSPILTFDGFRAGAYRATCWDTEAGTVVAVQLVQAVSDGTLTLELPGFVADLAVAVTPEGARPNIETTCFRIEAN